MADQLQAIETEYKGYLMRSRLEARWAVFFDAFGIKWAYEDEGYKLPSGYYLPDFVFIDLDIIIEIKPKYPTEEEIQKCRELARFRNVIIIYGRPWPDEYKIMKFENHDGYIDVLDGYIFAEGRRCPFGKLFITSDDQGFSRLCNISKRGVCESFDTNNCCERFPIPDSTKIKTAYMFARRERFGT